MSIDLSIIVPAYNEETNIEGCIQTVIQAFETRKISFEIIVVDDGSSDNTLDVIRKTADNDTRITALTNGRNYGKGYTVKHGVLESKGAWVLFTDVDLSTPIEEFDKLVASLEKGYDIAFGSRALAESELQVSQPWYRVWLGRLANKAIQMVVPALRGIKDTQCGFKLFQGNVARRIFPLQRNERWGFDFEILHIARKHNYRVIEIPVIWSHGGDSRIRLSDYPRTLMELFKVRFNETKGLYHLAPKE